MNYLNNVNFKKLLPFFISFFISFCFIYYKVFVLGLILNEGSAYNPSGTFESADYVVPAKTLLENNSISAFFSELDTRMPMYPLMISFFMKLFGYKFIYILFFQSFLYASTIFILIKTVNLFIKENFWLNIVIALTNLHILFYSSLILPEILLLFFLMSGIYLYLNFFLKKKNIYLFVGTFFFGLAYITKPVAILLPYFLTISLVFFFISKKKLNYKKYFLIILPLIILFSLASPINIYNYNNINSAESSTQKWGHLLLFVYPCLKQKYGCGKRDMNEVKKIDKIIEDEKNKLLIKKYKINKSPYTKLDLTTVTIKELTKEDRLSLSNVYKEQFFELIKDLDVKIAMQSITMSYAKLMLHNSSVNIFNMHKIDYSEYKLPNNFTKFTFFWLIAEILLIISRFLQVYCLYDYIKNNSNKRFLIFFLFFFCMCFLIPAIAVGNHRYRLPIETVLTIFTILGLAKLLRKLHLPRFI